MLTWNVSLWVLGFLGVFWEFWTILSPEKNKIINLFEKKHNQCLDQLPNTLASGMKNKKTGSVGNLTIYFF